MGGLSTIVGVHLDESTVVDHRVYADQDRAVVDLEPPRDEHRSCRLTLFARRGELVRLRDALSDVLVELDAARQAWEADNSEGSPSEAA